MVITKNALSHWHYFLGVPEAQSNKFSSAKQVFPGWKAPRDQAINSIIST